MKLSEFIKTVTKDELRTICEISGKLDKVVEFKCDENKRWKLVNYFTGEDIEDCYCLSQYCVRSTTDPERQNKDLCDRIEVGVPYYLSAFDCGGVHCRPGKPNENCRFSGMWTYGDPGKCACWQAEEMVRGEEDNGYYLSLIQPTVQQIIESWRKDI